MTVDERPNGSGTNAATAAANGTRHDAPRGDVPLAERTEFTGDDWRVDADSSAQEHPSVPASIGPTAAGTAAAATAVAGTAVAARGRGVGPPVPRTPNSRVPVRPGPRPVERGAVRPPSLAPGSKGAPAALAPGARAIPPGAPAPDVHTRAGRRARKRLPRRERVPFWRGRVLPKSVLGISMLIFAFGVGAAASGAALYMYYTYRVDTSDQLIKNFREQFALAKDTIRADAQNARVQIQNELEPIRKVAAAGETMSGLLSEVQPSVWAVRTFDPAGQPTIGTAFVVASDSEKTFMVTSYSTVQAATVQPGPDIFVRKGNEDLKAALWTWDENRDMALLIVNRGNLARLDWAPANTVRLGDRVFAVSGLGTSGGAITQGFIADVSSIGMQHDAPLGTAFQGGPLINAQGRVVGMGSRSYAPLGFTSDGVYFAPPVNAACDKVLRCPNGVVTGAGARR